MGYGECKNFICVLSLVLKKYFDCSINIGSLGMELLRSVGNLLKTVGTPRVTFEGDRKWKE